MTKTPNRLSRTTTKPILAGVVGFALLLFVAILFVPARPSPPAITVRHVKSLQSRDWVSATFEFTNHTTIHYLGYPVSVEIRKGLVWKTCFDYQSPPGEPGITIRSNSAFLLSIATNLPTGSPLRLRMSVEKELTGLEGLFLRLDLRFRRGQKQLSLNPFDKRTKVFSYSTQVVSDEFVEPEPEPTNKTKTAASSLLVEPL